MYMSVNWEMIDTNMDHKRSFLQKVKINVTYHKQHVVIWGAVALLISEHYRNYFSHQASFLVVTAKD